MRFACWITKATNTHPEYLIIIAFYASNDYVNVPQCYVTHILLVLFWLVCQEVLYGCGN